MMIDEDSLKSRVMVMVMVMVRITIRIANPNHDPAGCGLTQPPSVATASGIAPVTVLK